MRITEYLIDKNTTGFDKIYKVQAFLNGNKCVINVYDDTNAVNPVLASEIVDVTDDPLTRGFVVLGFIESVKQQFNDDNQSGGVLVPKPM